MIALVSVKTRHLFSEDFAMALQRKRLVDEIYQTVPKHEMVGLIEILGSIRESRIRLMQEAFFKEASVADAKLQRLAESGIRSPHRSEVQEQDQYGHW